MLRDLIKPVPASEQTTIVPRTVFEAPAPVGSASLIDETDLAVLDFNHAQNLKAHDSAIVWYAVMHSKTGDAAYLDAIQRIAAHIANKP